LLEIIWSIFSAKTGLFYGQELVEKIQKWVPKAVGQTVGSFCHPLTPFSNQLM
jgi:hypothetical protein